MERNVPYNDDVILTPSERARLARKKNVCALYERLREENPTAAPHRLMKCIADRYNRSLSGVRNILIDSGLFTPNSAVLTNNNNN